jgi:hypothetical protein
MDCFQEVTVPPTLLVEVFAQLRKDWALGILVLSMKLVETMAVAYVATGIISTSLAAFIGAFHW